MALSLSLSLSVSRFFLIFAAWWRVRVLPFLAAAGSAASPRAAVPPEVSAARMSHLIVLAMAKGSFLGVKRGKLGDTVAYCVTNSKDKDKQGWRPYQPKVRNPQTEGQIDQRVKMAAVNNLYRALKPIIQRGWENHKYGDESRRAFLKRALGASFTGPYIEKGSTLAAPIDGVPITYGSLPPIVVSCPGGSNLPVLISVTAPSDAEPETMADISTIFINSGMAQAGDQVTFVFGWIPDTTSIVVYKEISFIIDPSDARTTTEAIGTEFVVSDVEDEGRLSIGEFSGFDYDAYDYCFLCSISRNGDGMNLRSYAEFTMTATFRAHFYDNAEQNAAAKRSYRKNQSADTNWPLVPDSDIVLPVGTTHAMVNSSTPAQVQVNAYRAQNGYLQVWDNTNSVWRYVYCTDVRLSQYQKWLTTDKLTTGMWSSTAPTGAVATDAVRMQSTSDANAADLWFDAWLVDNGYSGRYIYGSI